MGEHALCRLEEIPGEGAVEVKMDGERPSFLILMRREDRIFAYLNVCPHAGRPLNWAPDQFLFTPDDQLVCAAHGATFEPDSGICVLGPCLGARLTPFEIEVRDGQVWPA